MQFTLGVRFFLATTKVYIKLLTYSFKGSALSSVNVLLTNTIEDCVCTSLYIIMYV